MLAFILNWTYSLRVGMINLCFIKNLKKVVKKKPQHLEHFSAGEERDMC
jgi:hypothetical protein